MSGFFSPQRFLKCIQSMILFVLFTGLTFSFFLTPCASGHQFHCAQQRHSFIQKPAFWVSAQSTLPLSNPALALCLV